MPAFAPLRTARPRLRWFTGVPPALDEKHLRENVWFKDA